MSRHRLVRLIALIGLTLAIAIPVGRFADSIQTSRGISLEDTSCNSSSFANCICGGVNIPPDYVAPKPHGFPFKDDNDNLLKCTASSMNPAVLNQIVAFVLVAAVVFATMGLSSVVKKRRRKRQKA